jgi:CRISPR-associated protein Cas1
MKRLLNTLFVMTQGSYLRKDGETVVVRLGEETRLRVPVLALNSIVCFGDVLMSPALMGHCARQGISISYLSAYGRFLARIMGPTSGNVLLRREQYRISDDPERAAIVARSVVTAKIVNSFNGRCAITEILWHPRGLGRSAPRYGDQLTPLLRRLN